MSREDIPFGLLCTDAYFHLPTLEILHLDVLFRERKCGIEIQVSGVITHPTHLAFRLLALAVIPEATQPAWSANRAAGTGYDPAPCRVRG